MIVCLVWLGPLRFRDACSKERNFRSWQPEETEPRHEWGQLIVYFLAIARCYNCYSELLVTVCVNCKFKPCYVSCLTHTGADCPESYPWRQRAKVLDGWSQTVQRHRLWLVPQHQVRSRLVYKIITNTNYHKWAQILHWRLAEYCRSTVWEALQDYISNFICYIELTSVHSREEPIDYGDLDTSLRKTCTKMGLKDVDGKFCCGELLNIWFPE